MINDPAAFVAGPRLGACTPCSSRPEEGSPRVHDAYRREVHARYLQGAAKAISAARLAASDQVLDTVKSLYEGAVGRFRKTLAPTDCIHLCRPGRRR